MYPFLNSVNFCVSGSATDWYWNTRNTRVTTSAARLITRHWGSVVAGSFMNGFFEVPTLLIELLTCHRRTCCNKLGVCCEKSCCGGWGCFFHLVRTDSYAYINLAGEPFCNAGRECYDVCIQADQFVAGYNPMKHYRFAASVFLTTLLYILGSIYVNKRVVNFYWWENVVLVVISYAVVCWFVDISANAAEGVSTSFLTEYAVCHGYEGMEFAFEVVSDLFSPFVWTSISSSERGRPGTVWANPSNSEKKNSKKATVSDLHQGTIIDYHSIKEVSSQLIMVSIRVACLTSPSMACSSCWID
jgi:hypothetical protein